MSSTQAHGAVATASSTSQTQIKLNLGCGGAWSVPGWFGIDQRSTSSIWQVSNEQQFLDLDARKGLPFATNSVDVVFSSHTLEHFTYEEAIALLFEIYRVLKIGSPLCLVVPDMDLYIENYVRRNTDFLTTPQIIGGNPRGNLADNFLMNFYSDPSFNNTCHKYAYNFENLSNNLKLIGFDDVQRVDFHDFTYWPELKSDAFKSPIKNIERFSLCVQARKRNFDGSFRNRPLFKEAQKYSRFQQSEQQLAQELNSVVRLQEGLAAQYEQALARESARAADNQRLQAELAHVSAAAEHNARALQQRSEELGQMHSDAARRKEEAKILQNEVQKLKTNLADVEAELDKTAHEADKRFGELSQTNNATYQELQSAIAAYQRQTALYEKEQETVLAKEKRVQLTVKRVTLPAKPFRTISKRWSSAGYKLRLWKLPLLNKAFGLPVARMRETVTHSGIFEPAWYLQQHPDIVSKNIDPLTHYLQYGGTEGRNPGPLFDTGLYVTSNPAVRWIGLNPLLHYLQYGTEEGGDPHFLFSSNWYAAQYPDVAHSSTSLLSHYVRYGAAEGRDPHPLFDSDWYLTRYPDVAAAGANPLAHYVQQGIIEARDPHPLFDNGWYLSEYPEVAAAKILPLIHYLQQDAANRFNPNALFEGSWYLANYPDVARSGIHPLMHYVSFGSTELRNPSPLFDSRWYAERYPEALQSGSSPLAHYLGQEASTGYNPNPFFNGAWYLKQYPDVAESGLKPIVHYLRHGAKEGRNPSPNFDTSGYLRQYPDVAESGMNPLVHFLQFGIAEGRSPVSVERSTTVSSDMQKVMARSASDPSIDYSASATRYSPLISVLIPTFNTPARFLKEVVQSIREQTYTKWELCIVDDGSTDETCINLLNEIAHSDSRIKVHFSPANQGIALSSQQALELATGEFVAFVDHDDILAPHALGEVIHLLRQDPTASVIYTDHAMMDENGTLLSPALKPAWSPELFLSTNYLVHFKVIRRTLVHELGGFIDTIHVAQDIGLSCKVADSKAAVHHLPKVLYYWRVHRGSVTSGTSAKPEIEMAALRTYNGLLKCRTNEAKLIWPDYFQTRKIGAYKVDFTNQPSRKVAVILPITRTFDYNRFNLHFQRTDLVPLPSLHLISMKKSADIRGERCPEVHTAETQTDFNRILEQIDCDVFVFMSPDALTVSSGWLKELVGYFSISPQIGAVGGKVLDAHLRVHSGGLLLLNRITPICAELPDESDGYWFNGRIASNVEAVSSQLLATPKTTYFEAGGVPFFEYQDASGVAYGLRLRALGYRIVYNPWAKIVSLNSELISDHLHTKLRETFGSVIQQDRYYHPFYSRETPYTLA